METESVVSAEDAHDSPASEFAGFPTAQLSTGHGDSDSTSSVVKTRERPLPPLPPIPELPTWQMVESGKPGSLSYRARIFEWKNRREVSPWHGIPLYTGSSALHVVCKTPRDSGFIFEVARDENFTPLKLRKLPQQPAYYTCNAPCHVGLLPQTWADPGAASDGMQQDGNPFEVLDISRRAARTGQVYAAKPLAAFAVIHGGTTLSWKIIVIALDDPLAGELKNVNDVQERMPDALAEVREWLRTCMWRNSGDPDVYFGLDGTVGDCQLAVTVIAKAHKAWLRKFGDKEGHRSRGDQQLNSIKSSKGRPQDTLQRAYSVHQSQIGLSKVSCCEPKKPNSESQCGLLWVEGSERPSCLSGVPPPVNPTPTSSQSPASHMLVEAGVGPGPGGIGCWKGIIGKLVGGIRLDSDLCSSSISEGPHSPKATAASHIHQRRRPPPPPRLNPEIAKQEPAGRVSEMQEPAVRLSSRHQSLRIHAGSDFVGDSLPTPTLSRSKTFSEGQFAAQKRSRAPLGMGVTGFALPEDADTNDGVKHQGLQGLSGPSQTVASRNKVGTFDPRAVIKDENEIGPSLDRSQTISEGQYAAQKQARGKGSMDEPHSFTKNLTGGTSRENKLLMQTTAGISFSAADASERRLSTRSGTLGKIENSPGRVRPSLDRSQTISEGQFVNQKQSTTKRFDLDLPGGVVVTEETGAYVEDSESAQFYFMTSQPQPFDQATFPASNNSLPPFPRQNNTGHSYDSSKLKPSLSRSQSFSEGQSAAARQSRISYSMGLMGEASSSSIGGMNEGDLVVLESMPTASEARRGPTAGGREVPYASRLHADESPRDSPTEWKFVAQQSVRRVDREQAGRRQRIQEDGPDGGEPAWDERRYAGTSGKQKVTGSLQGPPAVLPLTQTTEAILRQRENLTRKLEESARRLAAEEDSERIGARSRVRAGDYASVGRQLHDRAEGSGSSVSMYAPEFKDAESSRPVDWATWLGRGEGRAAEAQSSLISHRSLQAMIRESAWSQHQPAGASLYRSGATQDLFNSSRQASHPAESLRTGGEAMDIRWEADDWKGGGEGGVRYAESGEMGVGMASQNGPRSGHVPAREGMISDKSADEEVTLSIKEDDSASSVSGVRLSLGRPAAFLSVPREVLRRL